jgi:hypothetical protein
MASTNGQKTFNFALCVSSEDAEKVEKVIAEHADWMRKSHSLEAGGGIHLVDYYVARADEQNNMTDPSQGTTGNILYSINETYILPEGIDQHMEQAMKWEGFEQFVGTLQKYGKVLIGGGTVIQAMQ